MNYTCTSHDRTKMQVLSIDNVIIGKAEVVLKRDSTDLDKLIHCENRVFIRTFAKHNKYNLLPPKFINTGFCGYKFEVITFLK